MSLLLDALKKAAEQKAQKSQGEPTPDRHRDETLLDVGAGNIAHQAAPGEGSAGSAGDDETEFDQSQVGARLDRTGRLRGAGDDTGLELPDATETRLEQDQSLRAAEDDTGLELQDAASTYIEQKISQRNLGDETGLDIPDAGGIAEPGDDDLGDQMQAGEDESIIFAAEDATNFVVESEPVEQAPRASEDETDLDQLAQNKSPIRSPIRSPKTDEPTPGSDVEAEDETDLSVLTAEEDRAGDGEHSAGGVAESEDETDLSRLRSNDDADAPTNDDEADPGQPQISDETPADGLPPGSDDADAPANDDEADPGQPQISDEAPADGLPPSNDDTDISQPSSFADQIAAAQVQQQPEDQSEAREDSEPGADVIVDEDLSLLLIEPESIDPGLNGDSSFTDPQIPLDRDAAHTDRALGIE